MGDGNLPPEVLQAAGRVEEVCGKVICPSVPTCKNSVIDYFVVDRRLLQAVRYVKRMEGFGITPHHPVRMAIMVLPRKMRVRRMVAPRKIPAVLPQGCLAEKDCERAGGGGQGECTEAGAVDGWQERVQQWFGKVEEIVCGIMGLEGKAAERIGGRGQGPKMVWKCALGPPGDKPAFSTKVSRSWAKLRGWCSTIRQAGRVLGTEDEGGHPLAKAAQVCGRRIRAAERWGWRGGGGLRRADSVC